MAKELLHTSARESDEVDDRRSLLLPRFSTLSPIIPEKVIYVLMSSLGLIKRNPDRQEEMRNYHANRV